MTEPHGRSTAGQLLSIIASGWARLGITFFVGLVFTAMMISEFGLIRFGMYIFIVQVTDLTLYAFFSALSRTMIRDFTSLRARGESQEFRRVFSCGVVISASLFVLIALVGVPLHALAPIALDFPTELHTDLMNLVLATAVLGGFYLGITPWQAMVVSSGKILQLNAFYLSLRVGDLLALLAVARFGPENGFLAFIWTRLALRVVGMTLLAMYGRKQSDNARFVPSLVRKETFRRLGRTGGLAMSIPISQFSLYELDQIFLNVFAGPIYNSIYGVSNQLRGYARLAGSSIILGTDALASDLQERGRLDSARNVLDATVRFPLIITGCCAILLAVFAQPVVTIWLFDAIQEGLTSSEFTADGLVSMITSFAVLMIVGTVIAEPHYSAISVLYGLGHLRRIAPVLLASAVLKPTITVALLASGFPAISAIVVTVSIQAIVYGVYFPWLIGRVSERSPRRLFVSVYLRPLTSLAIFLGIAIGVRSLVTIDSVVDLGLVLGLTGATYAPLGYFLALKPTERKRIIGMIAGRLGRSRAKTAPAPVAGQPAQDQPPGSASTTSDIDTPR